MPRVVVFPEARILAVGNRVVTWRISEFRVPYESAFPPIYNKTIPDQILEAGEQIEIRRFYNTWLLDLVTCVDIGPVHRNLTLYVQPHHNFVRRIRAVQQMWRERRAAKRLAFMSGLHQRLGADSVLFNLDEGILKMCCF